MKITLGQRLAAVALLGAGLCLSAGPPQDAGPAPTPEVARLVAMTGLWDTQTVFTGMPATSGFAKLIMMGNWLIEEFKGELDGQSVQGRGITGWDPGKQRYTHAWVTTTESKLNVVDQTWDDAQHAFVADSQLLDLGSGPTSVRATTAMPDADTIVLTFTPAAPDALPALTITYTRNR